MLAIHHRFATVTRPNIATLLLQTLDDAQACTHSMVFHGNTSTLQPEQPEVTHASEVHARAQQQVDDHCKDDTKITPMAADASHAVLRPVTYASHKHGTDMSLYKHGRTCASLAEAGWQRKRVLLKQRQTVQKFVF